jgi:glycosyltransferase involved in cell wall biosynthesis
MPRMPIAVDAPATDAALRFVSGSELAATFRAADLVVLPYREIDQSGVLYTALAFGKPLLLSAVGGFPEVEGAELVPPGDAEALAAKLTRLLASPHGPAAAGTSWDEIARRTLALYAALQT